MRRLTLFVILGAFVVFQPAWGQIPETINYQGVVKEKSTGEPLEGDHTFLFKIYDTPDTLVVTALWEEEQILEVTGGIFNAILGSVQTLDLAFDEPYWLGVEVDGEGELRPRAELASSPYALRAEVANSVVGGGADSDWIIDGSNMYAGVPGNVGIGTPDPAQPLDVYGDTYLGGSSTHYDGDSEAVHIRGKSGYWRLVVENKETASDTDMFIRPGSGGAYVYYGYNGSMALGIQDPVGKLAVSNPEDSDFITLYTGGAERFALTGHSTGTDYLGIRCKITDPDTVVAVFTQDGRVGIGTYAPVEALDVRGTAKMDGLQLDASPTAGYVLTCDGSGNGTWQPPGEFTLPYDGYTNSSNPALDIGNYGSGGAIEGYTRTAVGVYGHSGYAPLPTQGVGVVGEHDISGTVGELGNNLAGVKGTYGSSGPHGSLGLATAGVNAYNPSSSASAALATDDYAVHGIGDSYFEGGSFTVSGTSSFSGGATFTNGTVTVPVLEITGGSDLSEQFDIRGSADPAPGMVVCIDPRNPGELVVSDQPYDRRVAGIISGAGGVAPGMLMGQEGSRADGSTPVALTGRVYCWADASTGPIVPGDLLTTSGTLGHAMKVADFTKAQGAILGKAMTSLEDGKGLVLVLVTLQ